MPILFLLWMKVNCHKGTHEQLMKEHGWYKEMYESQQLEALVEKGGV